MGIKKILLVEDDPNFGIVLKDYLALNDYHVTHAKDGIEGLIMFKNNDFDLCILLLNKHNRSRFQKSH